MAQPPTRFLIGLDLGQARDYTALAVLERVRMTRTATQTREAGAMRYTRPVTEELPTVYHCRHLERFRLSTPYPAVVEQVGELLRSPALLHQATLVVDYTGVGRPVVDMMRGAGLAPVPVTITGGDVVTRDGRAWRVPKRDLVGVVQVLLQSERLKFASALALTPALVAELTAFRVKITAAANDTYGVWREGAHDDLVLACAVALWYAERPVAQSSASYLTSRSYFNIG